ncbi:hypothetical protein ILYODFUR_028368, partial [Ilyodon furcidens]
MSMNVFVLLALFVFMCRYNNRVSNASMSVLNIGIPAGYLVDRNDLESLSNGDNQIFHKFEKYAVWPEIEPLIIYMKTVSNTQAEKISFKIQQMLAHHALQPAAVSVYDFHNKNCSKQIKEKMSTDDRFTKSCESTPTSKIEY